MARLARIVVLGYPHHITQRDNRRQPTFFCDEDFGDVYLYLLRDLLENKNNSMGNIRLWRIKVAHPTVVLKEQ